MDISLKLKEKASVLRFKNGSPKLKDVLRKKCKERLQNNRNNFIDRLRNIECDVKEELTNMMKEDLKTVYTTVNNNVYIGSKGDEEIFDEELEWLMNQYDEIFGNEECLMKMFDDLNEVLCPICQRSNLNEEIRSEGNVVHCRLCKYIIPIGCDLLQVKENIMSSLEDHNHNCSANPQFSLLSEGKDNHVFIICYDCSTFNMIM